MAPPRGSTVVRPPCYDDFRRHRGKVVSGGPITKTLPELQVERLVRFQLKEKQGYWIGDPAGEHARIQREQAAMTECPAGHPLTDDNLHVAPDASGRLRRRCLRCAQERLDAHKREKQQKDFEERYGAYLD